MAELKLLYTAKFKKDVKRLRKQGADLAKLEAVIDALLRGKSLSDKNRDHELSGNYKGHRECHIEPDWLLIYLVKHDELTLTAVRTGSHSELLNM